jgi:hypothetical protein
MHDFRLRLVYAWGIVSLLFHILPRMLDAAPLMHGVECCQNIEAESTGQLCCPFVAESGQVLGSQVSSPGSTPYVLAAVCINRDVNWIVQDRDEAPGMSVGSSLSPTTAGTSLARGRGGILDKYDEIPDTISVVEVLLDQWRKFCLRRAANEGQVRQVASCGVVSKE